MNAYTSQNLNLIRGCQCRGGCHSYPGAELPLLTPTLKDLRRSRQWAGLGSETSVPSTSLRQWDSGSSARPSWEDKLVAQSVF